LTFVFSGRYSGSSIWRHVAFEHPSTFETLAMDPAKKKDMDDLLHSSFLFYSMERMPIAGSSPPCPTGCLRHWPLH
jgi:hypothetical protein